MYNSYILEHGKTIILFCLVSIVLGHKLGLDRVKYIGLFSLLFSYYFFRIIRFEVPRKSDDLIYSPSYGKVVDVSFEKVNGQKYVHVATFISIFDPHIQYSPVNGFLTHKKYVEGNFAPAMFFYKSNNNERLHYFVNTKHGQVIFTQIAGMIARTIVPFVKDKTILKQGQEIGLIKFGSRCDVYFPYKQGMKVFVKKGDYVKGGQTIFGSY